MEELNAVSEAEAVVHLDVVVVLVLKNDVMIVANGDISPEIVKDTVDEVEADERADPGLAHVLHQEIEIASHAHVAGARVTEDRAAEVGAFREVQAVADQSPGLRNEVVMQVLTLVKMENEKILKLPCISCVLPFLTFTIKFSFHCFFCPSCSSPL